MADDTELIDELDLSRQAVVGSDLGKRIVLVMKRLVEVGAHLLQELLDGLFTYRSTKCQRVDKHTHRVTNQQVGTAIGYCCDAHLFAVGKARQRIVDCRQDQMSRRDVVVATESFYRLDIERRNSFTDGAFGRISQIRTHLSSSLNNSQALLEEVLGCLILCSTFCSQLGRYIAGIREILFLNRFAIHNAA